MIKSCLLIATRKDRASLNIANNLLRMFQWKEIQADSFSPLENKIIISKIPNNKFVILWIINEPLLAFDKPNEKLTRLLGPQFHNNSISDILFLSKHVSTAGTASLTVHPIGIPYQEENSRSGGMPGRCSPPSNHIGALMRSVYTESKAKGLDKYFKITLEATHHGPYVEIPTCFVEIGSTEEEWANEEAGEIWSTCLGKHFSLSIKDFLDDSVSVDSQFEIFDSFLELPQESFEDEIPNTSKIAVICIGSGHYVPKLNDIVKFGDNFLIGHALATYAFDGLFENVEKPTKWKEIILEAVNSTKLTFKDMKIVCYLDKKSFKSEHRYLIGEYLNELGVQYSDKTNDIKKML